MIQSNYYEDNPDIQMHVDRFIDWEEVVRLYEDGFRDAAAYERTGDERLAMAPHSTEEALDYYRSIFQAYGDLCGNEMSQLAQKMDQEGLKFESGTVTHPAEFANFFEKFHAAGLHPTSFQRRYGGLGLPHVVKALSQELSYRADTSLSIAVGSVNLAAIMEAYASPEMSAEWLPKLIDNRYTVTMGLSEPDFGSDLPNVRTRAELIDGKWYLTGTKRFQTMACGVNGQPSAVLALARTGKTGGGARGLSFFLVEGKDIEITGIEKKLGLKASATCEVAFEKSPAHLIGEEGHGLTKYVIGMLNGARMSVASQGAGMATAAYFEARKYANERIQFGKPIADIPAVARMLRRMEREIAAMRCLMVEAALSVDRYHWRMLHLREDGKSEREIKNDPAIRQGEKLASALTPMSKYYNSELVNQITYDAIQVFGGAGYIEEYDVARLYRDARIANIYDGTTQIQINAAIGGVVQGLSVAGNLRGYIEKLLEAPGISQRSRDLFQELQQIVEIYRGLDAPTREELSFEVVESCTRLLNGLFLEKTAGKLEGADADHRFEMAREYIVDSAGILARNRIRLQAATENERAHRDQKRSA